MKTTTALLKRIFRWLQGIWKGGAYALGSLLLFGFFFLLLASVFSGPAETTSFQGRKEVLQEGATEQTVAVVDLNGVIVEQAEQSGPFAVNAGVIDARSTSQLLDELTQDESVEAIMLRINSPGGTVVASDELYRAVQDLSAEKPVLASFADTAASGGYYIALGADEIMAHPASLTGSIGVIAQFPQIEGLLDTLGVEIRSIQSGEYKDIGSPTRDFTEEEEAIIESVIADSYESFLQALMESRDLDRTTAERLADGRIYSGVQAAENGLVDSTGAYDDATTRTASLAELDDPRIVRYSSGSFLDSLLGAVVPWELHTQVTLQQSGLWYIWE